MDGGTICSKVAYAYGLLLDIGCSMRLCAAGRQYGISDS